MAYTPPEFTLLMDVWSTGPASAGPADHTGVPCAKYVFSRTDSPATPPWSAGFWVEWHPLILIRTPFAPPFDVTVPNLYATAAMVEVPSGSGSFYLVRFAEIMHEGFPNQYVALGTVQCLDDGSVLSPVIP